MRTFSAVLVFLSLFMPRNSSFRSVHQGNTHRKLSYRKDVAAKFESFLPTFLTRGEILSGILPDKELNRKFRRTIFTKKDWKRHRSSNRYFKDLMNMPKSTTLRSLGLQSLTVTLFSILIVVYNMMVERSGFPRYIPLLSFPPLPFSLTSSALGLLLVFRTNTAYARWKDARISWATISARSYDLIRQTAMWITDESPKQQLIRYTVAFSKCVKWHLGHQGNDRRLADDLEITLTKSEIEKLLKSRNRILWMLQKMADVIAKSGLPYNAQSNLDKSICDLNGAFHVCDRIFTTPIPLVYTRHTARFLLLWLLTVPMSLYHEFRKASHWRMIFWVPLISFFNATFLFGIEELGVQIEEPFSILPLASICHEIQLAGSDTLADSGLQFFTEESSSSTSSGNSSGSSSTAKKDEPTISIPIPAFVDPLVPVAVSTPLEPVIIPETASSFVHPAVAVAAVASVSSKASESHSAVSVVVTDHSKLGHSTSNSDSSNSDRKPI